MTQTINNDRKILIDIRAAIEFLHEIKKKNGSLRGMASENENTNTLEDGLISLLEEFYKLVVEVKDCKEFVVNKAASIDQSMLQ
jgi:hypothetical protein